MINPALILDNSQGLVVAQEPDNLTHQTLRASLGLQSSQVVQLPRWGHLRASVPGPHLTWALGA